MEEVSLFLEEVLKGFLNSVKDLVIVSEDFEGVTICMALVSIFLDVHRILGLFHDSLPLHVDLVEDGRLLGKVLHGKRRLEDRL